MYIIDVSVLFTGDNLDHNILTIDGNGTFHGMGNIAVLAPRKQLGIVVPRKQVAELHVKEHAAIVPKPDDVSYQNKTSRAVHTGIIRVLLSDRSDLFTLPLATGSVCFDFLLSPLILTSIVCNYRISCRLYNRL